MIDLVQVNKAYNFTSLRVLLGFDPNLKCKPTTSALLHGE